MPATRRLLVVLALALLAACGGDDEAASTTTSTSTTGPGSTTTTEVGAGRPLNDSALVGRLLPLDAFPTGVVAEAPDNGAFNPTLCPEVALAVTWDDQAAQLLARRQGGTGLLLSQAVLAFPDEATARQFVAAVEDGTTTCNPEVDVAEVAAGDEAVRMSRVPEVGPLVDSVAARVGSVVTYLFLIGDAAGEGVGEVLTTALVADAAARLAG